MAPPTIPIEQRFAEKHEVDQTSGCWVWTASLRANGYAQFRYSKARNGYGHIFAYEYFVGPIPDGTTIDHLCRNRACVNPAHLEAVQHRVNVLRGDGPTAKNARKTHCPRGHAYQGDNLYVAPGGRRSCRACQRAYRSTETVKQYNRDYQRAYRRERYATDEAFREDQKQRSRAHAAQIREDAKRWRALQGR